MSIITVYAPSHIDLNDSYGIIAHQLATHLESCGIGVNVMSLGDRGQWDKPIQGPSLGGVFLGYPGGYGKHDNPLATMGRRVAVTMFESTQLPEDWPCTLNQMDAVIVPSEFCLETFKASGVTAPIHVVPLGISETFQPHWRPYGRKPYTFLATGDRGKRKNVDAALQAFQSAFGDDENYRLVIKTRDPKDGARVSFTNPNIDVIHQDMSEDELYRLYCDCDCMVFPSRGEGFGLPPREFAATGGPVIATNWSGLTDDIEVWGIPLDYELVTADWLASKNLEGQPLGLWAEPSIDHLAEQMRCVADHSQAYRIRAHHAATRIHGLYSWHNFATVVYDIWRGNDGCN